MNNKIYDYKDLVDDNGLPEVEPVSTAPTELGLSIEDREEEFVEQWVTSGEFQKILEDEDYEQIDQFLYDLAEAQHAAREAMKQEDYWS